MPKINIKQLIKQDNFDLNATIQAIMGENGKYTKQKSIDLYNLFHFLVNDEIPALKVTMEKKPFDYFTQVLPALRSAALVLNAWYQEKTCNITEAQLKAISTHFANQQIALSMRLLKVKTHDKKIKQDQAVILRFIHIMQNEFIWHSEWSHGVKFDDYLLALEKIVKMMGEQKKPDPENLMAMVGLMTDWIKIESDELKLKHQKSMLNIIRELQIAFINVNLKCPLDLHSCHFYLLNQSGMLDTPVLILEHQNVLDQIEAAMVGECGESIESQLRACHQRYQFHREKNNQEKAVACGRQMIDLIASCQDEEVKGVYDALIPMILAYLDQFPEPDAALIAPSPAVNPVIDLDQPQQEAMHSVERPALLSASDLIELDELVASGRVPQFAFEVLGNPDVADTMAHQPSSESCPENTQGALPRYDLMMPDPWPTSRPSDSSEFKEAHHPRTTKDAQRADIRGILCDWDETLVDKEDINGNKGVFIINQESFKLLAIAKNMGIKVGILTARSRSMDEGQRAVAMRDAQTQKTKYQILSARDSAIPKVLEAHGWRWIFAPGSVYYADLFQRYPNNDCYYQLPFELDTKKTKKAEFENFCRDNKILHEQVVVFDDSPDVIRDITGALKIIVPDLKSGKKHDFIARKFKLFDEILSVIMQGILYGDHFTLQNRLDAAKEVFGLRHKFSKSTWDDYCHDLDWAYRWLSQKIAELSWSRESSANEKRQLEAGRDDSASKRVKQDEVYASSSRLFSSASKAYSHSSEKREARHYKK